MSDVLTSPAPTPYTAFLNGLDDDPSPEECRAWALAHPGDPEEGVAWQEAGSFAAFEDRHEDALDAYRRGAELGGEHSRECRSGIVSELLNLKRGSEADEAQRALLDELAAQAPGIDDAEFCQFVEHMVGTLRRHEHVEAALAWCRAGLDHLAEDADRTAPAGGPPLRAYRHSLLTARRGLRETLGLSADDEDRAAEAGTDAARADLQQWVDRMTRNTVPETVLVWAREDFAAVRERWPETTADFGDDYAAYTERIQREAREARSRSNAGTGRVHLLVATLAELDAYARHTGLDTADPNTRRSYSRWRTGHAATTGLPWPPNRNAPCWCDSGRKYKKCCGSPAKN